MADFNLFTKDSMFLAHMHSKYMHGYVQTNIHYSVQLRYLYIFSIKRLITHTIAPHRIIICFRYHSNDNDNTKLLFPLISEQKGSTNNGSCRKQLPSVGICSSVNSPANELLLLLNANSSAVA